MTEDQLTQLSPEDGVQKYLAKCRSEKAEQTIEGQGYDLESWLAFCEQEGIDNLNDVDGRILYDFYNKRLNGEVVKRGDTEETYQSIQPQTLERILHTLRNALDLWSQIDACRQGLREQVAMPELTQEDRKRDTYLEPDRAREILDNLDRYHYASLDHVIFAVLWHTGMRVGALQSLDVDDVDYENACLHLRHRPETGTTLKNKEKGQRDVAVGDYYLEVLEDYIDHHRNKVVDDYGRRPLISSEHGRLNQGPIRNRVHRLTQPCEWADCPHGEEPDSCSWRRYDQRAGCPSSRFPHALRSGRLTQHARDGDPRKLVEDRLDTECWDTYDESNEFEQMQVRRDKFNHV